LLLLHGYLASFLVLFLFCGGMFLIHTTLSGLLNHSLESHHGVINGLYLASCYLGGAMGSIFFANINPELWENISISMLTLFRVATFEDWTDVMYETMEVYPISWLYYLTFIFVVAFVFLNMMIGIVLETLQKEHEKFERETGEGEAGEVHWIREHTEIMEERLERIEQLLRADRRE
jgi:voltage-gated sodium channel